MKTYTIRPLECESVNQGELLKGADMSVRELITEIIRSTIDSAKRGQESDCLMPDGWEDVLADKTTKEIEAVLVPAGDGKPVTEEWLREVGLSERLDVFRNEKAYLSTEKSTTAMLCAMASACAGPKCWDWHSLAVTANIPNPTRGQLRKLAEVLGIQLKP